MIIAYRDYPRHYRRFVSGQRRARISEVFPVVVLFWNRNPIVDQDKSAQYIVFFLRLTPTSSGHPCHTTQTYTYSQGQPKKKHDISWPIIMAKSLLSWPTIGFLIQKLTTIGKTSLIVGHICPEKNYDNIVAAHDTQ